MAEQATERFYIGSAEDIEAEYGAVELFGSPFVVASADLTGIYSIEGFPTMEAARASLAEIEDRSTIEFVGSAA